MKRFAQSAASALLASILLCACGGDEGGAASSGDAGPAPARPIDWKPLPAEGAPSARYLHTAVWTGSKMIIWGGFGATDAAADGGIYDPATDTWSPMSTAGQPAPRTNYSAVWTGSTMIIWGGTVNSKPVATGGAYDPAKDTWTAVSAGSAPKPRFNHSAVYTGSTMIVWGGYDFFDWFGDGATLDLSGGGGGSWVGATAAVGSFIPREGHTGVWTGSRMLIWGGWTGGPYDGNGSQFNPTGGSWTPMSTTDAPSARGEHVSVWAGDELVVWGGCGEGTCSSVYGDGGRFTPDESGGHWTHVAEQPGLSPRRGAAGVTTGSEIYIWGGRSNAKDRLATGAQSVL